MEFGHLIELSPCKKCSWISAEIHWVIQQEQIEQRQGRDMWEKDSAQTRQEGFLSQILSI